MIGTGRKQLAAPQTTAFTGQAMGSQNSTLTHFSVGDTTLANNYDPGAATFDVATAGAIGFVNGDVLIVGYGSDNSEEVTATVSGVTFTITVPASGGLTKSHKKGARVVRKSALRAVRPGSVVINRVGGSNPVAKDDGLGNITGTDTATITGKVDYSTGLANIDYSAAVATGAMTMDGEALNDKVQIDDPNGQGYFANDLVSYGSREGAADFAIITNLGSGTMGVFAEISRDGGKSFTMKNFGSACQIKGRCSATIRVPRGTGPILDQVRWRAGVKPGTLSTLDADEALCIQEGKVEIDYINTRNNNAGGI